MKIFYLFTIILLSTLNCCIGQVNFITTIPHNKTFQLQEVTQATDTTYSDYLPKVALNKRFSQSDEMKSLEMVKSILEKEKSDFFKSGIFSGAFKSQSKDSDKLQGEVLIIMGHFISSILEMK
ncbi:MAG: hypothetical protein KTR26_07735 [Flammeovirgaceae bacterium]|nr:hypothetical protein [Flammeovirgaceae bacterium]